MLWTITQKAGGVARHSVAVTGYGGSAVKRTPLKRGKGLSPISKKRKSQAPIRKALRDQQLSLVPYCEASLIGIGCNLLASDCHEIIPRGRRPGAELDAALFVSLCRLCHSFVTQNPDWATRHGLMLHATANETDLAIASFIRSALDCELPPSLRQTCSLDHWTKYE